VSEGRTLKLIHTVNFRRSALRASSSSPRVRGATWSPSATVESFRVGYRVFVGPHRAAAARELHPWAVTTPAWVSELRATPRGASSTRGSPTAGAPRVRGQPRQHAVPHPGRGGPTTEATVVMPSAARSSCWENAGGYLSPARRWPCSAPARSPHGHQLVKALVPPACPHSAPRASLLPSAGISLRRGVVATAVRRIQLPRSDRPLEGRRSRDRLRGRRRHFDHPSDGPSPRQVCWWPSITGPLTADVTTRFAATSRLTERRRGRPQRGPRVSPLLAARAAHPPSRSSRPLPRSRVPRSDGTSSGSARRPCQWWSSSMGGRPNLRGSRLPLLVAVRVPCPGRGAFPRQNRGDDGCCSGRPIAADLPSSPSTGRAGRQAWAAGRRRQPDNRRWLGPRLRHVKGQSPDGLRRSRLESPTRSVTRLPSGNISSTTPRSRACALGRASRSARVKTGAPWKISGRLLAHAKAKPCQLRRGKLPVRGSCHASGGRRLETRAGVKLTHVPFGPRLSR